MRDNLFIKFPGPQHALTLPTASPPATTTMTVTSTAVTTSTPSPEMSLVAGSITTAATRLSMRETTELAALWCPGS